MKKLLIVIIMALLSTAMITVSAQGSLKIGHVNSGEVLQLLPATDSINQQLRSEAEELQKELQNMQDELNVAVDEFQKNSETWSKLIKETKQSEIADMQTRMQRFNQSANDQIANRNRELFQPIYEQIQKAIEEVAAEQKLSYVLDTGSGAVLYTSPSSIDIKEMVLKKLGVNK